VFGKSVFKTYSSIIGLISRVSDPVSVFFAAVAAHGLRFGFQDIDFSKDYRFLVGFAILSVIIVFPLFNLYTSWRGQSLLKQAKMVFWAWCVVVTVMIILLFAMKISAVYSRIWLGSWAILGLLFILASRIAVYAFLQYQRRKRRNIRSVFIVGAGDLGRRVKVQIDLSPWTGYVVSGFFDDAPALKGTLVDDVEVKGSIDEVEQFMSSGEVDEIWLALPLRAEERMKELLYGLRHHTINIKLIPDIFGFSILNHSMTEIAGLPAVNLSDTPMGGANRIVKELEDRLLAIIILVLIGPVALIIAALIKLTSPGPILFKQKRHGWDGRVINIYKFRTMIMHAEDDDCLTQACKNDPRVTKIGRFLRKTSLDELPQFYNVLQGRMSIVGPRPHAVQHNELYKEKVDRYMLRHMVKPGITGWAQVNGYRGETDTIDKMKKRIEYDLFYIENWSLWLDIKIILMTLLKGFRDKNAY
jgi:putative colanic acid biosynthesis UDP-glucose lipid carrier transferase